MSWFKFVRDMKYWLRFVRDIRYDMLVPPLGLDFHSMKPKQAEENFIWFTGNIIGRTDYLRTRCAKDLGISIDILDFSPESLVTIWKWFLKTAYIEKTPKDELAQMKKQFAHLGDSFINKDKFSVVTEFIMRDIGMYIGSAFTAKSEYIKWGYYTKPKNNIHVNQPLLTGFFDKSFDPPFAMVFEPVHMVGVQAAKIFRKAAKEDDLYNIFLLWSNSFLPSS